MGGGRRPWQVWRSPEDQPGWARPCLLLTAAFAAALYAWNITSSGYAMFYSDSVKSMSVSWKALLFGAMDPGATITPDKIAGSFVPQAISARIFGFHQWSVTLPQCIEGVICVLVMYRMVRRWVGPKAGIIAAALFTLTPVCASMFGHAMEDGALTMCLVLAADRFQVAVERGRLRSLVMSGVWVGLGFQAKMMQAWMILPALALAYLLTAPGHLRKRVWHLLVAGVVCAAVSLSWVAMMTVVPAKDRPYVDGSTNNSAVAMVFGYNGLERFGIHLSGALPSMGGGGQGAPGGKSGAGKGATGGMPGGAFGGSGSKPGSGSGTAGGAAAGGFGGSGGFTPPNGSAPNGSAPNGSAPNGSAPNGSAPNGSAPGGSGMPGGSGASGGSGMPGGFGASGTGSHARGGGSGMPGGGKGGFMGQSGSPWTKLFQGRFAPEISWTLPFAAIALAFGLLRRRRAGRTDVVRGGFVTWGTWLVVVGLVFSKMSSIPHTAYMATLAPPLAALCGAGAVLMWRAYRAGGRSAWVLPAAVAVQAGWTFYLWSDSASSFLPWLKWLTLVGAVAGAVALVLGRLSGRNRTRVGVTGLLLGLTAAFGGTVAWSASAFDSRYDGSAFDAGAGPSSMGGMGGGMPASFGGKGSTSHGSSVAKGAKGGKDAKGATAGMGGMTATASLTSDERKLWNYVSEHRDGAEYPLATIGWRQAESYILVTGEKVLPIGGFSGSVPQPTLTAFEQMVKEGKVRYVLSQGSGSAMGMGMGGSSGGSSQAISKWVTAHCSKVPAEDYGVKDSGSTSSARSSGPAAMFGGSGTGSLYLCTAGS
ncbi:glycosyltransferase family 39 protein [Streptantibioticus parmotrematis]|uniref:glycosyltransferase family 39 protein n=1 Tax=Streptantibioticus parmotrematis TaxID=2873249 RepID=UPI0027E01476|nr:glycosyltransferase family 39 protein [Streptantibioticus parmotrematis]